jgi:hypothetical protein
VQVLMDFEGLTHESQDLFRAALAIKNHLMANIAYSSVSPFGRQRMRPPYRSHAARSPQRSHETPTRDPTKDWTALNLATIAEQYEEIKVDRGKIHRPLAGEPCILPKYRSVPCKSFPMNWAAILGAVSTISPGGVSSARIGYVTTKSRLSIARQRSSRVRIQRPGMAQTTIRRFAPPACLFNGSTTTFSM